MKRTVVFILLICMVLLFSACGNEEITMQEIYDASQIEDMLENHESVYIQDEIDGEIFSEKYLTKEYVYENYPDEEFAFAQFTLDDANYAYSSGDYLRYLYITPDGVTNDFSKDRAERYGSFLSEQETVQGTVESINEKEGRITVKSFFGEELLEDLAENGITSGKTEYTLDAKTNELISVISDYTYEDGTFNITTEIAYDAEVPEMLDVFLKYMNQAENLRNVTVVTNPGTEKEVRQNFQIPKGLVIGFTWDDAFEDKVGLYADAACTEDYDPYVNTDSDLTVYVKWVE